MTTPAPDISSLLDQLQEQLSVVIKERDELRAERTRLREVLQLILKEAEFVGDAKAPFTTWVAMNIRAALNNQKGPSE